MKELIAVVAAFLLLVPLSIQPLYDAAFNSREIVFDEEVHTYAEEARVAGCFTPEIISNMKAELCAKLPGLAANDISVVATTSKKYRGDSAGDDSLISFSVSMPLRKRFIGGLIFGDAAKTTQVYTCAGQVYSEALH